MLSNFHLTLAPPLLSSSVFPDFANDLKNLFYWEYLLQKELLVQVAASYLSIFLDTQ